MTRRTIGLFVALGIVVALTALVWRLKGPGAGARAEAGAHAGEATDAHAGEEAAAPEGEAVGPSIAGLQTTRVDFVTLDETLVLNGEVVADADRGARVGSPVSGRIVSLRAKVGDAVRAGQTVAVVASRDVAEVESALLRAAAEERAAAGRLATLRQLASTGALTQRPVEEARRDYGAMSAAAKQASSAVTRAKGAREVAVAELDRVQKLASAKAFAARPVEEAQREIAEAQLELETATAQVRVRQIAHDRSQRLFEAGIAARRDVEAAEADHEEARARKAEAEAHVGVARRALSREESISSQDLYTLAEVRDAKDKLRQADRDLEVANAELERTRGHLAVSESALARERQIAGRGLLARRDLQEAEADLAVARAQVASARNSLASFRAAGGRREGGAAGIAIVAPVAGIVTEREASPGQAVEASTDLFVIQAADPVWVIGHAYEKDLPRIGKGQLARVTVKGYPDEVFEGKVTQIGAALDPKTRTARVRCVVPNETGVLRPGMFASVEVVTEGQRRGLLVPRAAVLDDAGAKVVYIRCNECPEDKVPGGKGCGAYDRIVVTLGARHGSAVEITEGLEAGSMVVTAGQYQLKTAMGSGKLEAGCTGH